MNAARAPIDIAAQRGVLGHAGARMQRGTGLRQLRARRIGIGVPALHAAHGGQREPSLRLALSARPREQPFEDAHRVVELVQILLDRGPHHQQVVGHRRLVRPWLERRHRHAGKARIAGFVRLLEIPARHGQRQRDVARLFGERLAQALLLGAPARARPGALR